jgi:hypothetical protein
MENFDKEKLTRRQFDKNKAWGDVKKYYTVQSIIVLVLIGIVFSVVIPKIIPPSREEVESRRDELREVMNSSYDSGLARGREEGIIEGKKAIYDEVILRMLLAGMNYSEIYSLVKPDRSLVNFDRMKEELKVMSDKQIIELKNIDIIELNRLRTLFQKEVKE